MAWIEDKANRYKDEAAALSDTLPDVAEAYRRFAGAGFAPGELDACTKHLIALGISLFANNEACTLYHVQEARDHGATDRQIMEAAAVAAAASSSHVLSQGARRVQEALSGSEGPERSESSLRYAFVSPSY
jgi:AhpD family alkylhydroperoxidase